MVRSSWCRKLLISFLHFDNYNISVIWYYFSRIISDWNLLITSHSSTFTYCSSHLDWRALPLYLPFYTFMIWSTRRTVRFQLNRTFRLEYFKLMLMSYTVCIAIDPFCAGAGFAGWTDRVGSVFKQYDHISHNQVMSPNVLVLVYSQIEFPLVNNKRRAWCDYFMIVRTQIYILKLVFYQIFLWGC